MQNHNAVTNYNPIHGGKFKQLLISLMQLTRLNNRVGLWLIYIPGTMGVLLPYRVYGVIENKAQIIYLFIIVLLARSCLCGINDIWDAKMDSQVERCKVRPIANGSITRFSAFVCMMLLAALCVAMGYYLLLPQLFYECVVLGVLCAIYPTCKRFFPWPQFVLGATFNGLAYVSWMAATNFTHSIYIYLLMTFLLLWTAGYDTIYALQDLRDDIRQKLRSTSILAINFRFGPKAYVFIIYILSALPLVYIQLLHGGVRLYNVYMILLGVAFFLLCGHLLTLKISADENHLDRGYTSPYFHFRIQLLIGCLITLAIALL